MAGTVQGANEGEQSDAESAASIYRDRRGGVRGDSVHFEGTGSKSPHKSELPVEAAVVEEAGAAELELVASRSTKEPAEETRHG